MSALYGRDGESAELGRLVAAAAEGAGGIAVVEGAAGIGKSRLLAEAARIAAHHGVQVAAGAADELDQVTPWAPLLRALSATDPVLLSEADLPAAGRLIDERLAVIEGMRGALEQASGLRPVLIMIDDLQWADPATLLALGSLPVQLFSYPIAWILARRPLPASDRLQGLTERLREAGAARLHLRPLDAAAATALAADLLGRRPDATLADLVAQAAGSPLYIVELLRGGAIKRTRAADAVSPPASRIPASLRAAVAAHLRSLPDPARDLLKVASVLGREFTVAELAATTGQPASQLLPAVGQALTAEVLAEAGDRLAFRHDVLRQAVYADLPASLRQALHRDAAAALRGAGAPLIRVAGQYAAGAGPGDEEAIEVLNLAAAELAASSATAAADLAVRALSLLTAGDERRAAMTASTVGVLGWAGRLDEARALGEGYLAGHRRTPGGEAEILMGIRLAWVMHYMRAYPTPLPDRVLDDPAVPASVRAHLLAMEQVGPMWAGDFGRVDRGLATAERLAAAVGDADGEAARLLALWMRTYSEMMRGDLSTALRRERGALDGVSGEATPVTVAYSRYNVALCLGGLGRPREALAALELTLQDADGSGSTLLVSQCLQRRAEILYAQARLDDARAEADAAAVFADSLEFADPLASSLTLLADIGIRQGDLAGAEAAVARLPADDESMYPERHWARALCLDARGEPQAAMRILKPAFAQLSRGCLVVAAWQASRLPRLVGLALRAGDRRRAIQAADAAAELCRRNPGAGPLAGAAAHARGLVERDPGLVRQAAGLLSAGEWPLATAAAREDLGCLLAGPGPGEQAIGELEAAYASYTEAGAQRDAARVRGALRNLGIRKRRSSVARPAHGWGSLTGAELAVVRIVAEGRTNRETAAQLYLSPDTVNTHLRHAFAKLGVRSRVELARLALLAQTEATVRNRPAASP